MILGLLFLTAEKMSREKRREIVSIGKFCLLFLCEAHFLSVSAVKTTITLFLAFTFYKSPHGIKT